MEMEEPARSFVASLAVLGHARMCGWEWEWDRFGRSGLGGRLCLFCLVMGWDGMALLVVGHYYLGEMR